MQVHAVSASHASPCKSLRVMQIHASTCKSLQHVDASPYRSCKSTQDPAKFRIPPGFGIGVGDREATRDTMGMWVGFCMPRPPPPSLGAPLCAVRESAFDTTHMSWHPSNRQRACHRTTHAALQALPPPSCSHRMPCIASSRLSAMPPRRARA